MYVCICNALKDRQLADAACGSAGGPGAPSVAEVFRRCGARPQCGKCLPDVARMIDAAIGADSRAIAAE